MESDDSGNNQLSYVYSESTGAVTTGTTTVTDALGHVTRYGWRDFNGWKKLASITYPAGQVMTIEYDQDAMPIGQTDPLGRKTRFSHDAQGNTTSAVEPTGATTKAAYEPIFNNPTSLTDAKNNKTNMTYDGKGNLVQVQDALNNFTLFGYDGQGHLTEIKDPLGNRTSMAYNALGAAVSMTDPLGRTTNMARDALNRVTANTDPSGKQTTFAYDNAGNVTQVRDALNGVTNFAFQAGRFGRLMSSVTDAKGHATGFAYDALGRLTAQTNALNQVKSYVYDKNGNLTSATDRKGQTIGYSYDDLGWLVNKALPEGNVQYQYDAMGNLTRVANYNGSAVARSYDSLNRITQEVQTLPDGFSVTIGYGYDANGNRTNMTTPWGSFSYAYDQLDRLTRITNPQGKVFSYSYDASGRRTQMNYPNGITTTYAYDAGSQLTQILHRRTSDNTVVAFANYAYDAAGNRTGMTDLSGEHSYGYDDLHRLVSASHPQGSFVETKEESFSYDAVGNRLADADISGYQYDAGNRLTENSSFTYTYDANGNQTGKTEKATGHITSFGYNSENQLTQVNLPDETASSYKYDALGRRVEKAVGISGNSTITRYIYDGLNLLTILDGANNPTAVFTQGLGINTALVMHRADGTDFFYHADALGSVVALTDGTGVVEERAEYEAYGKPSFIDVRGPPIISSVSFTGSPIAFTGLVYDGETGLFYSMWRYYNPEIGRFFQEDPMGFSGGAIDLYSYVGDNPTIYSDVLGLGFDPYGSLLNEIAQQLIVKGVPAENIPKMLSPLIGGLSLGVPIAGPLAVSETGIGLVTILVGAAFVGGYAIGEAINQFLLNRSPSLGVIPDFRRKKHIRRNCNPING